MRVLAITDASHCPWIWGSGVRLFGLTQGACGASRPHLLAVGRDNTNDRLVRGLESVGGPAKVFDRGPAPPGRAAAAVGRWGKALKAGIPPWVALLPVTWSRKPTLPMIRLVHPAGSSSTARSGGKSTAGQSQSILTNVSAPSLVPSNAMRPRGDKYRQ
jgi:hypothetical protein